MRCGWWLLSVVGLLALGAFMQPVTAAPFQPGQIFVAYGGNQIGVFADTVTLAGTKVQDVSISPSSFTTGTTLSDGGGVAIDELGNLYVTVRNVDTGNSGIVKIDRNGNVVWRADSSGTLDYRGIVASTQIRPDDGGRVFVATEGGTGRRGIHVYRASTGARLSGEDFGGTLAFRDLAFDKHGNLYGLRQPATGTIEVRRWIAGNFVGDGDVLFTATGNTDGRAIVVDEDGYIYISVNPAGGPFVRKFTPGGTLVTTYSTPSGAGTLIGLDYDIGTQRLFASHTGTGIGQFLAIDLKTGTVTTFGPSGATALSGVRWLAVYPTHEPATAVLVATGLGWWLLRHRRKPSKHQPS